MEQKRLSVPLVSICLVLLIMVLPFVGACAAPPEEEAPPPPPEEEAPPAPPEALKLGIAVALSGPAAPWGIAMDNIWRMQADQINDAGGITVKGQTYMWEPITYDNEYVPSTAVTVVTRLVVKDNVKFIFQLGGDMVAATQTITEPAEVLMFGWAGNTKEIVNPDKFYYFPYGIEPEACMILYPWLYENAGVRSLAILPVDTELGRSFVELSEFAAKESGIEVVSVDYVAREEINFVPVLIKILALEPDFIDAPGLAPATMALVIKQARELGFEGGMNVSTPDIPTLKEVAGWSNCENVYLCPEQVKENELQRKFKADYIERYGEEMWPGSVAYTMGDWLPWLTQAIEEAQSLDTTTIVNYLTTMEYEGLWGPTVIGGEPYYGIDRVPIAPYYIARVENGEIVQVIDGIKAEILLK